MTEDKYMAEFYSKDHDEYLVNGAILECDKANERPKDPNLPKRQEAACIWYNILTGENDEK